jgi:hypothetical protein
MAWNRYDNNKSMKAPFQTRESRFCFRIAMFLDFVQLPDFLNAQKTDLSPSSSEGMETPTLDQ